MDGVLLLSRAQVERLLDPDVLVEAMAEALRAVAAGVVHAPDRTGAESPQPGILAVMPAYLPAGGGAEAAAVLATKLVSVFPGNHGLGLPSHQALIALFDAASGSPLALLDGTGITAARTAAVSALATRLLALPGARVLAVIGTGVQAHAHLRALLRVRAFAEVRIAGVTTAAAESMAAACARWPEGTLSAGARVHAAAAAHQAVSGGGTTPPADVVCCCTDARTPVIQRAWLRPGAHVTSVGFPGPELDADTIAAGLLVVESRAAFAPYPAGAAELQGRDAAAAVELGALAAGTRVGRTQAGELTVFKSVGHAAEDAAAARLAYARARAGGVGTRFDFNA